MNDILRIEPHIKLERIDIWFPKYATDECLILKKKKYCYERIDPKKHYKIVFTKAKHLKGKEFYVSGATIRKSPTGTNGTSEVWRVPMDALKLMEQERSW